MYIVLENKAIMRSKDNNLDGTGLPGELENNSQLRVYAIVCWYVCLFLVKFAYMKIFFGPFFVCDVTDRNLLCTLFQCYSFKLMVRYCNAPDKHLSSLVL